MTRVYIGAGQIPDETNANQTEILVFQNAESCPIAEQKKIDHKKLILRLFAP